MSLLLEQLEQRVLLTAPPLSSYPTAPTSVYLDFDGWTQPSFLGRTNISTPAWTGSSNEITKVWQRVSEIYSPFDVNVTTVQPADLSHGHTAVVVIGGSYNDWFGAPSGGVTSQVGAFLNINQPNVSYVFPDGLSQSAGLIAVAAAHEAGHQFGLHHQSDFSGGVLTSEYSKGTVAQGPVMGNGYLGIRSTWSFGTADVSDGHGIIGWQNDQVVLGSVLGFRPDNYGRNQQMATPVTAAQNGVIDLPWSQDWFTFTTTGGPATFQMSVASSTLTQHDYLQLATLHAYLELWSPAGGLIATGGSPVVLGASIALNLPAGKYYVVAMSYGNWGDVGSYTLTANIAGRATPAAFEGVAGYVTTADGALYEGDANGTWLLLSPTGTVLNAQESIDPRGRVEVFALAADHSLWLFTDRWQQLSPAGTILSMTASLDDQVFVQASDSSYWQWSTDGWVLK